MVLPIYLWMNTFGLPSQSLNLQTSSSSLKYHPGYVYGLSFAVSSATSSIAGVLASWRLWLPIVTQMDCLRFRICAFLGLGVYGCRGLGVLGVKGFGVRGTSGGLGFFRSKHSSTLVWCTIPCRPNVKFFQTLRNIT